MKDRPPPCFSADQSSLVCGPAVDLALCQQRPGWERSGEGDVWRVGLSTLLPHEVSWFTPSRQVHPSAELWSFDGDGVQDR